VPVASLFRERTLPAVAEAQHPVQVALKMQLSTQQEAAEAVP